MDRLEWHAAQGHSLVLVSGTLEPLAQEVARALEMQLAQRKAAAEIRVRATRLEELNGYWTGRIRGEAMFGRAKARAIRGIAIELGLDLARCFAYGNSKNDEEMLAAVGKPMAVNPSAALARIAQKKQWPILNWEKEKGSTLRGLRMQKVQKSNQAKKNEQNLQAFCANSGNGK